MPASFGVANKSYVSAIQLLDKREINPNSLDLNDEQGLTDILNIAGRYKPSTEASFHHYVNDPLFQQGEIAATPTGSGTVASPLVIQLTAATSGFARLNDEIRFKSGKVGYIIAISRGTQDSITVRPVNSSVTLAGAAADKLTFFGNAVGERSLALSNRRYSMTKYMNLIQAFREVNEESDIQTMSAIEVNFDGQARYHVKSLGDKYIFHKGQVNATMIAGSMSIKADGTTPSQFLDTSGSEAIADPTGTGATQFTRGLDEYMAIGGINTAVNALDTVTMSDFESLIAKLLVAKAPKSFTAYTGTRAQIKADNTLGGVNNLLSQGRLELDGKSFEIGVKKLIYGGFNIQFANLPILDNSDLFGSSDIYKNMYFIPNDKVKVKGGGSEPRIQVRYMKHNLAASTNKGNDIWGEFHTGGLAPTGATSDEMVWRTNWITYQGLEVLGAQHMAKLQVLS